jgi:hypothetical protein
LHNAAFLGHLESCRLLVAAQANLESRTDDDMTPLLCAAQHIRGRVRTWLLSARADPRAVSAEFNNEITDLLTVAALNAGYGDDPAGVAISKCAAVQDFISKSAAAFHSEDSWTASPLFDMSLLTEISSVVSEYVPDTRVAIARWKAQLFADAAQRAHLASYSQTSQGNCVVDSRLFDFNLVRLIASFITPHTLRQFQAKQ